MSAAAHIMAKDVSNIVSLQAARKKAAEEEVRRLKKSAAALGQGPLSKIQLVMIGLAVVIAYLVISYAMGGFSI